MSCQWGRSDLSEYTAFIKPIYNHCVPSLAFRAQDSMLKGEFLRAVHLGTQGRNALTYWILRKRKKTLQHQHSPPRMFQRWAEKKDRSCNFCNAIGAQGRESTSKKKKNLGRGSCSKASKVFEFHYCRKIKEGKNRERSNFACKLYISYSRYEWNYIHVAADTAHSTRNDISNQNGVC